ncbi:MAG: hypothetical protein EZS28_035169, partial [Streblomastix strix]
MIRQKEDKFLKMRLKDNDKRKKFEQGKDSDIENDSQLGKDKEINNEKEDVQLDKEFMIIRIMMKKKIN